MTELWSSGEVATATGGRASRPFGITGVSIDTRTLRQGDLFVALIGETGDGHDHVAQALAKGGSALVHRIPAGLAGDARLIVVDDTLRALWALAAAGRARFAGTLIAVTGSVGKTTAKEMLRTACAAFGPTHAAEASHNNHWGLPLTLARLPRDACFCIAEIGMNHAGEIAPLARLAKPHATLITTIGTAHIGHLGSQAAIADEKAAIQSGLGVGGLSILPADTAHLPRLIAAAGPARTFRFGDAAAADARIERIDPGAEGSDIVARILRRSIAFRLPVPGRHMAMNATAVLLVLAALGLDPARAAAALSGFAPLAGRGVRRAIRIAGGSLLLLDESYNASTAAVLAALDVLAATPAQRRIAVLGDMLEMGAAGPAEHAALLPALRGIDRGFFCGPLMRDVAAAMPGAVWHPDSASLAPALTADLRPGDAILVKGSLGMRMKTIVSAIDALAAPAPLAEGSR